MTDLERVLHYAIERKNDCNRLKDICERLKDISFFSNEFNAELIGMKEAYDSIVNYIYFLQNKVPENTADKELEDKKELYKKELEDKKQNTFTKDDQEYLYLNKFGAVINPCYVNSKNCENCSFYKEFLSQGKIYVGDCPCTWCSNLQVNCSTNTQENEFYNKEDKDE